MECSIKISYREFMRHFWGFALGFVAQRYNTLAASMLMHMFYNLMGTLIVDLESRFLPAIVMGMIILISIPMTVSAVTLICLTTNNKKQRFEKMRFVIQRVTEASVTIDGEISGKIGKGYLVLIGVADTDTKEIADKMIRKMIGLRIFEDEQGKTNLSLADVDGGLLLVSQFTLYANCKRGNRPSFIEAGKPDMANEMYEYIIEKCRESVDEVQTGEFGADMKVQLLNDGPFTILLDSDQL